MQSTIDPGVAFSPQAFLMVTSVVGSLTMAIVFLFRLVVTTKDERIKRAEAQVDTLLPAIEALTKAIDAATDLLEDAHPPPARPTRR